jgi:hypothetical protein
LEQCISGGSDAALYAFSSHILLYTFTSSTVHCSTPSLSPASSSTTSAVVVAIGEDYTVMLAEFPGMVNASKVLPPVTHKAEHFIEQRGGR